jgi:Sec-independent protein translocase protein TatA
MIKKIYGTMDPAEQEDHTRLLALEINSNLSKIYKTLKPETGLEPQKITKKDLKLMHASFGATKMWEFRLNSREKVAEGDVGRVVVVTRGLTDDMLRKQRALLIAAEFYVYHAFANHPDPRMFKSIRSQNQYLDLLKRILHITNSHDLRDQAIRYVIEEIEEHKIAHHRHPWWYLNIAALKGHHPEIAKALGSSEKTFKEALRKQDQRFTPEMLKQEEDLIRKEIEEMQHIITLLRQHEHKKNQKEMKRLIDIHIADLKTFINVLEKIRKSLDKWAIEDKREHDELKRKIGMTRTELRRLLEAESEAENIDINKVHLVFHHFKKEKINILRDLELLDTADAQKHQAAYLKRNAQGRT